MRVKELPYQSRMDALALGLMGCLHNRFSLVGWAVPTIIISSFILRQYPPEIPSALHPNPAGTSLSQHTDEMSNTASLSVHLQSDTLPRSDFT